MTGVMQRAGSIDLIFEIMTLCREALSLDVRRRLQDAALVAAEIAFREFSLLRALTSRDADSCSAPTPLILPSTFTITSEKAAVRLSEGGVKPPHSTAGCARKCPNLRATAEAVL